MNLSAISIIAGLLVAGTAQAQPAMVQAVRPPSTEKLNRHLSRLASSPRDVDALVGAGEAAIDLDDMRAAAGFFARADVVQPNNGRVKAGLGRVMLKTQNATEALRMFDQAVKLGYPEATLLSDRGLARDLTGDQAGAQRDYQAALKRTPDDTELTYRYAASLGISGQVDAAEKVLQPLLYKSDRPAWRFRAFILAMNNRQDDARKIASQTMPGQLAAALTPYMVKMPYLTAAQKAAAVHFGHFPKTIGSAIAAVTPTPAPLPATPSAVAPSSAAPPQAAPPTAAAAPARQSRVPLQSEKTTALARADNRVAPSASVQTRAATTTATTLVEPERARPTPPPAPPLTTAPARPSASGSAQVQGPPAPGFESLSAQPTATPTAPQAAPPAAVAQAPAQVVQPTPAQPAASGAAAPAAPQPDPEATRTLADIIRTIDVPDSERRPTVAAVDLAEVAALQAARRAEQQAADEQAKKAAQAAKAKAAAAAKIKAEAEAKAKKAAEEKAKLAANPSRNWVQIGTGGDRGALAFTLKNLRRKYDDVAPQDGWVAGWGRTNRLLIGPFASFTRAKTVESKLKGAGADAFAWKSDAGEVVERLSAK